MGGEWTLLVLHFTLNLPSGKPVARDDKVEGSGWGMDAAGFHFTLNLPSGKPVARDDKGEGSGWEWTLLVLHFTLNLPSGKPVARDDKGELSLIGRTGSNNSQGQGWREKLERACVPQAVAI